MKLVAFGASGRTGRPLVRQALAAGHDVVAFVRDSAAFDVEDDGLVVADGGHLSVVEGDVLDSDAVSRAVDGADVVFSVLGHARGSPNDVLSVAADHIVEAMEARGVPRLIVLSGAAVRTNKDPSSLGARAMTGLVKLVPGDLFADSKRYVGRVAESDLEWVVVRAPRLTEGEHTGDYRVGYLKLGPRATVSRADVADFMLGEIRSDEWVGEMPMITS
ncbi:NAD(P)-dependent oxidoreductase [Halegenticoccus tardaugens]|uniref:NAD(P)-dependent oxidoreductase n=1 Tax=Halegenticoccus tardaugens TaxID=2071624 RepID=UPI0013E93137|nr:NAD(P)H-binding protein [Halegenticoccus tardaugens]